MSRNSVYPTLHNVCFNIKCLENMLQFLFLLFILKMIENEDNRKTSVGVKCLRKFKDHSFNI